MADLLQVLGALLILAGYGGAQWGAFDQKSYAYLVVNLIGSLLLAVLALDGEQWGFVLLETAWALISGWGIAERLRSGVSR